MKVFVFVELAAELYWKNMVSLKCTNFNLNAPKVKITIEVKINALNPQMRHSFYITLNSNSPN